MIPKIMQKDAGLIFLALAVAGLVITLIARAVLGPAPTSVQGKSTEPEEVYYYNKGNDPTEIRTFSRTEMQGLMVRYIECTIVQYGADVEISCVGF